MSLRMLPPHTVLEQPYRRSLKRTTFTVLTPHNTNLLGFPLSCTLFFATFAGTTICLHKISPERKFPAERKVPLPCRKHYHYQSADETAYDPPANSHRY